MHKKVYIIQVSICLFLVAICMGCQSDRQIVISNMEQSENDDLSDLASSQTVLSDDCETNIESETSKENETIFVQISGAVVNPGVYEVSKDARIFEAIELAGGMTEDASFDCVNQAQILSDGQMIRILTQQEFDDMNKKTLADDMVNGSDMASKSMESQNEMVDEAGRINLNLADEDTLCKLEGIGKARAKQIITYRTEHGNFQSIEEIKNIKGIKDNLFNQIKDKIKV